MRIFGKKAFAAALLASVTAPAFAADMPEPVIEIEQPSYGGWYLRGHIGMSNQRIKRLESELFAFPDAHGWHDEGTFGAAPTFGVGVGYQFNDFLRGDLTVEYRGNSEFSALDWQDNAGVITTNDYRGKKSEWLFLANAYADLGDFYGVTPYLGAGIGASRNTISSFRDINIINGGGAYADDKSRWDLAWALHAGVGIKATERMTIDLGYSFLSLGDGQTGELKNDDPAEPFPPAGNSGIRFKDITSHDFKLGVRYSLN
ncbi:outer membrane protein [Aminobacter aganoensis]|uniref:Opacity protein-like surface antigen n=1 Tax=Aminobacter aganoensis TaxID=83264 RepID=A0A7X0FB00_9HYPH|nr:MULTISPECIES: outer membrane beta-barrel protein [Aminobacter]KQU72958.1 cell envelope biogenesis protein OmpA [Aminobacter sp. DSM 101952]MBB6356104.1 opacity protein-like surface antigen [Aminobacter aganoensis]